MPDASLAAPALEAARDRLLATACDAFASDPDVVGIFLGGSLAAARADAWSDVDLRVAVTPSSHARFVAQRRKRPQGWPGFLFNEWLPGTHHCVSHFRPFVKIDIFYYDVDALAPSPWLSLPIAVLHDPQGRIAGLIEASRTLRFTLAEDDLDIAISKALAAAHETLRRARRGEVFYAWTLLDELRGRIMQADDWLHQRTPESAVLAKFEARSSPEIRAALAASYGPGSSEAVLAALAVLLPVYRRQLLALHEAFSPSRPRENDMAALDIVAALIEDGSAT